MVCSWHLLVPTRISSTTSSLLSVFSSSKSTCSRSIIKPSQKTINFLFCLLSGVASFQYFPDGSKQPASQMTLHNTLDWKRPLKTFTAKYLSEIKQKLSDDVFMARRARRRFYERRTLLLTDDLGAAGQKWLTSTHVSCSFPFCSLNWCWMCWRTFPLSWWTRD